MSPGIYKVDEEFVSRSSQKFYEPDIGRRKRESVLSNINKEMLSSFTG